MASEWILLQFELHYRAQSGETPPKIGQSSRNPNLCSGWQRDHPSHRSNTT
jgi:hypothetical protein